MKKTIALLAITLLLISCQPEGRIFSEHQDLSPNIEWLKKDVVNFEVPIEDKSTPYNLSLSFRYANGYQYQILLVKVTETSPSGKQLVTEHELKIREDNGEYIGEAGYDIWDSEHLIIPRKTYEEVGTYQYTIEQVMPVDVLHFAMEMGVIIDKAE